jgi:tetratricopeptide (TPR) repeat protein
VAAARRGGHRFRIGQGALAGGRYRDASGPAEALDRYRRALEVLGERKSPPNRARAHEGIARCLASTDRSAALRHAREAVELYRSMEMWEAGRAEAYLAELERAKAGKKV